MVVFNKSTNQVVVFNKSTNQVVVFNKSTNQVVVFNKSTYQVIILREELEQARADLLNDEKIFADQQCEYEKVKSELFAKIRDLEDETIQLKNDLENVKILSFLFQFSLNCIF